MKKFNAYFTLFIILSFLSCSKENSGFNCDSLRKGLINNDQQLVRLELNKVIKELTPKPSLSDPNGHLENLAIVIETIQDCNIISCELECYNCFHEDVTESIVHVEIDSSGVIKKFSILIATPENKPMFFAGLYLTN